MPGSMDGIKLARAVGDRWLPVKIVVVSGHLQVGDMDLRKFFSKPFQTDKVIDHIRRTILG
jgi:two-component system, response regulator PdtaR